MADTAKQLISLTRSNMSKPGIDITVKSSVGEARSFAPTWDMVMGHKNGTLSDADYIELYLPILDKAGKSWVWLRDQGKLNGNAVNLRCYCKNDSIFCHTHVAIDYAVKRWPHIFEDGRND